jgi:hypothetical protein
VLPYGVYVVTRGHAELRLLPVVARSLIGTDVGYVMECELVQRDQRMSIFCFDLIYSAKWRALKKTFVQRQDELSKLMGAIEKELVFEHPCGASVRVTRKPFLFVGTDSETIRAILQKRDGAFPQVFGEELTTNGNYDGLVVSFAQQHVRINDPRFQHMKLKRHHTIDLLVKARESGGVRLLYAVGGEERRVLVETGSSHLTMCVDGRDVALLPPPPGLEEYCDSHVEFCLSIENSGAIGLAFERLRGDIRRPNAKNTVISCIASTLNPFSPGDLLNALMPEPKRKRARGADAP